MTTGYQAGRGGGTPRNLSLPMSGHKPDEKFDSSFLTVAAGTVALNIIISFVYGLINNDKKSIFF